MYRLQIPHLPSYTCIVSFNSDHANLISLIRNKMKCGITCTTPHTNTLKLFKPFLVEKILKMISNRSFLVYAFYYSPLTQSFLSTADSSFRFIPFPIPSREHAHSCRFLTMDLFPHFLLIVSAYPSPSPQQVHRRD